VPCGPQGFVSGNCGRAVFFPWPTALADRDDRGGLPIDNGGVTAAGVIGSQTADIQIRIDRLNALGTAEIIRVA
jgi:hypothetical protein